MAFDGLLHLVIIDQAEDIREQNEVRILQRALRDSSDPFSLPNVLFLKLFRLNKYSARNLINSLQPHMVQPHRRIKVPIHLRVLIALHFFDQGSYQLDIGHGYSTTASQPVVSRCIAEVTNILTTHFLNQWIKFTTNEERKMVIKQCFAEIGHQFTDVVGVVDGTHIRIIAPPANHPVYPGGVYYCRKKIHAINTQIICDANRLILSINARFPGSVHDSAIWMTSGVKRALRQSYVENGQNNYLLGDSGYPLEPWLLVPFQNPPENTPESRFNTAFSHIRIIIEHTNGVLKSRFRCLLGHRALHYNPIRAAKIIYSCAILHNICITHNVPLPDDEGVPPQLPRPVNINRPNVANDHEWFDQGNRIRTQILRAYF